MAKLFGFCTLLAAFALVAFSGDSFGGEKDKKRKKGFGNPEEIFKKIDANGDGKVTKEEYTTIVTRFSDRVKEKSGEEAATKLREGMLKRFDAAATSGSLDLEQFKKMQADSPFGKRKKPADQ